MAPKLVLLLLGALLLVQNSLTAPTPDASSEETGENPFKGVIERFTLLEMTIDELIDIHKLILEKGKIVFSKVLEDPKVIEIKNEAMEENIAKIRKFLNEIEKDPSETESKVFEFLDEFGEILEKFDSTKTENLSEEAEIIEKSLKENGIEDFREAILDHFKIFIDKFSKEIETYIEKLTEKEKKEEEKLITWFEKLKAEKDIEKQFDMFDTFFTETDENSSSDSKE